MISKYSKVPNLSEETTKRNNHHLESNADTLSRLINLNCSKPWTGCKPPKRTWDTIFRYFQISLLSLLYSYILLNLNLIRIKRTFSTQSVASPFCLKLTKLCFWPQEECAWENVCPRWRHTCGLKPHDFREINEQHKRNYFFSQLWPSSSGLPIKYVSKTWLCFLINTCIHVCLGSCQRYFFWFTFRKAAQTIDANKKVKQRFKVSGKR